MIRPLKAYLFEINESGLQLSRQCAAGVVSRS
jgi:hypothetical protein